MSDEDYIISTWKLCILYRYQYCNVIISRTRHIKKKDADLIFKFIINTHIYKQVYDYMYISM